MEPASHGRGQFFIEIMNFNNDIYYRFLTFNEILRSDGKYPRNFYRQPELTCLSLWKKLIRTFKFITVRLSTWTVDITGDWKVKNNISTVVAREQFFRAINILRKVSTLNGICVQFNPQELIMHHQQKIDQGHNVDMELENG